MLPRPLRGNHQNAVPRAHAVHVDQQGFLRGALVPARKAPGAQHALFLIVEKHKGRVFPGLRRHQGHGLQHGGHAGSVVVCVMGIGRAEHHQRQRPEVNRHADDRPQGRTAPQKPCRSPRRGANCQQPQHQPHLIQQVDAHIAGGDEVGHRHGGRRIIVGGENHPGPVRVADDHVAPHGALLHPGVIAQAPRLLQGKIAEGLLLGTGFAHGILRLKLLQIIHGAFPSFC